ncbi:protein QUIRKY-like [Triticum aestivum]|uniref:protein QUIRKY-like n=1 Tax=Triticum aestivum TaxID=4565 RepID=UPI001D004FC7|nr:protein QUIRKY-like [Triticum aestivum]
MGTCKLIMTVELARGLIHRDGRGSPSAYVELCFDGQRIRSTSKEEDRNPAWNESFWFDVSPDPSNIHDLVLEASVYNTNESIQGRGKYFLGMVTQNVASFHRFYEPTHRRQAALYPLETRRGMPMVGVRGELLLNGYILDESPIRAPIPSSTPMGLCVEVINATNLKPVDYPVVVTKTSSNDFSDLTLRKWRNVLQKSLGYGSLETNDEQIKRCIQIGLMCVNPNRSNRLPIMKVIRMLQGLETISCDISNETTT